MSLVNTTDATEDDLEVLRSQLGRVPRGVVGIAARCVCGRPTVVATAPRLPDGTPFPTTYYLTHPAAVKGVSTLEAEHVMETLNEELAADEELRAAYARAHEAYIQARLTLGDVPEISGVSAGGMPTRVKCLHALVGHSLGERWRNAHARQVPARPRRPLSGRRPRRESDWGSRARDARRARPVLHLPLLLLSAFCPCPPRPRPGNTPVETKR